jgi:hypothetical protein
MGKIQENVDFHVLGLFIYKKHDLNEEKNPSVPRRCL